MGRAATDQVWDHSGQRTGGAARVSQGAHETTPPERRFVSGGDKINVGADSREETAITTRNLV